MSSVRTFFRHCPACGRRFEIRLVSRKLEKTESHTEDVHHYEGVASPYLSGVRVAPWVTVLDESMPVTVETDDFQYSYRCKHCGYEWSESHDVTRKA